MTPKKVFNCGCKKKAGNGCCLCSGRGWFVVSPNDERRFDVWERQEFMKGGDINSLVASSVSVQELDKVFVPKSKNIWFEYIQS